MENNFKIACEYISKDFSFEEIEKILNDGDDFAKVAVLLNIKNITNNDFANLIIKNLTHQSGPVREACAYALCELMPEFNGYFQDKNTLDIIIYSLNDVNPNVVRFMLETLRYINNKEYIFDKMLVNISNLYSEINNKQRRGKEQEHIFTKKCFKIYWSLEALKKIISEKSDIIEKTSSRGKTFYNLFKTLYTIDEYTIREKIAQITGMLQNDMLEEIRIELNRDKNYFVRRCGKDFNENISSR